MTRLVTFRELFVEELNKMLEEEGRDVRVVTEQPRPRLATRNGENIVPFNNQAEQKGI